MGAQNVLREKQTNKEENSALEMTDVIHSNILAVIVDLSPSVLASFGSESSTEVRRRHFNPNRNKLVMVTVFFCQFSIEHFAEAVVAFCNLYIASSPTNELLVYLSSPYSCNKVFPLPKKSAKDTKEVDQFSLLGNLLRGAIDSLSSAEYQESDQNGAADLPTTLLTGALTSALCCKIDFV